MQKDDLMQQFEYHNWANQKVWECVETLSEAQFTAPCSYSIGSVKEQCFHVLSTDWWIVQYNLGQLPDQDDPEYLKIEQIPDQQAMGETWDQVGEQLFDFVKNLSPDQLEMDIDVPAGEGVTFKVMLGELLLTLVNHGTNHRAQILRLIHDLGGETTEMGLYFYLMESSRVLSPE